ncbi:hypothetical protein [Streptomyces sp. 049-1]|uniref:hypothetical protein n=1 Tax=Streptomyces sp. 049-1 TaxID=2789264 RepID=UPI00397FB0D0
MTKWSRLARTRIGYAAGCVSLAVGAGMQFGAGMGLMVGGALTAGSFLLLSDVDSEGATDE